MLVDTNRDNILVQPEIRFSVSQAVWIVLSLDYQGGHDVIVATGRVINWGGGIVCVHADRASNIITFEKDADVFTTQEAAFREKERRMAEWK